MKIPIKDLEVGMIVTGMTNMGIYATGEITKINGDIVRIYDRELGCGVNIVWGLVNNCYLHTKIKGIITKPNAVSVLDENQEDIIESWAKLAYDFSKCTIRDTNFVICMRAILNQLGEFVSQITENKEKPE